MAIDTTPRLPNEMDISLALKWSAGRGPTGNFRRFGSVKPFWAPKHATTFTTSGDTTDPGSLDPSMCTTAVRAATG